MNYLRLKHLMHVTPFVLSSYVLELFLFFYTALLDKIPGFAKISIL